MSQYLGSLVLVLLGVGCSGTTDTGNGSGGGTSQGGAASGGNGSAGKATGGSVSTGGSPTVDPRCPATRPSGTCDAQDAGLSCQYDQFTGCLCFDNPNMFAFCQHADVNCPNVGSAGNGGAAAGNGGAAAGNGGAAAGNGGVGGFSAKIAAPPPHQVCSCNAGSWSCTSTI